MIQLTDFSFGEWLMVLIYLVVVYYMLVLAQWFLEQDKSNNFVNEKLRPVLNQLLVLYEPIGLIIVIATFILINPIANGLVIGLIFFFGYIPLRNYISGRVILITDTLRNGDRIDYKQTKGIIQQMNRYGLVLQTEQGNRMVSYSNLLADGYVRRKGKTVGRVHRMILKPNEKEIERSFTYIQDKIFTCPYVDWKITPTLKERSSEPGTVKLQVLIREETHLEQLTDLITEWGYQCRIQKKI